MSPAQFSQSKANQRGVTKQLKRNLEDRKKHQYKCSLNEPAIKRTANQVPDGISPLGDVLIT